MSLKLIRVTFIFRLFAILLQSDEFDWHEPQLIESSITGCMYSSHVTSFFNLKDTNHFNCWKD